MDPSFKILGGGEIMIKIDRVVDTSGHLSHVFSKIYTIGEKRKKFAWGKIIFRYKNGCKIS